MKKRREIVFFEMSVVCLFQFEQQVGLDIQNDTVNYRCICDRIHLISSISFHIIRTVVVVRAVVVISDE